MLPVPASSSPAEVPEAVPGRPVRAPAHGEGPALLALPFPFVFGSLPAPSSARVGRSSPFCLKAVLGPQTVNGCHVWRMF